MGAGVVRGERGTPGTGLGRRLGRRGERVVANECRSAAGSERLGCRGRTSVQGEVLAKTMGRMRRGNVEGVDEADSRGLRGSVLDSGSTE